jgi:hypothetical protein
VRIVVKASCHVKQNLAKMADYLAMELA